MQRQAEARAATGMTFGQAVTACHAAHAPAWGPKHTHEWQTTLRTYAAPLDAIPVASVSTEDVLKVPRSDTDHQAGDSRQGARTDRDGLDYAKALGWRDGENPARWRGHLQLLLPATNKIHAPGHHGALPWQKMPEFVLWLRGLDGISCRALEFTILTSARSAEARGAVWAEIDLASAVWIVPAQRMKSSREHRVPLSSATLDVLRAVAPLGQSDADFVFPGDRPGRPLSSATLLDVMHRLGEFNATVHGCRSSFSSWAAEATEFPRELVEAALAHVVGGAVERAYSRSDRLERRRVLMDDWAAFTGSHGT